MMAAKIQELYRRPAYLSGGATMLVTLILRKLWDPSSLSEIALIYLLLVVLSAYFSGFKAAFVATVCAWLGFNFFFTLPFYSFGIADHHGGILLTILGLVALFITFREKKLYQQRELISHYERNSARWDDLHRVLSTEVMIEKILPVVTQVTAQLLNVPACNVLLITAGHLVEQAHYGPSLAASKCTRVPIQVGSRLLGFLQVFWGLGTAGLTPRQQHTLQAIATQLAAALDHIQLVEKIEGLHELEEADRLKSILLSSVSHDLRTPLAILKPAVTTLLDTKADWNTVLTQELLLTINAQADRLDRLIENLLCMSKIEAGMLQQARTWHDLQELIITVITRLQPILATHPITTDIAPDLPLIMYPRIQTKKGAD